MMLIVLLLLAFVVGTCLALLMPALWAREIYKDYCASRAVVCPETHRQVAVSFDAWHAAVTGLTATKPELRLIECTRWPEHADCHQECLPDARSAGAYTQGEAEPPKTKKIYHLPVLIAAFVAWVLGVFWHSDYLFREQWTEALGLGQSSLRQILRLWTPHLLSVAAPLLFAYGVAWLLACSRRKGPWSGILAAVFLWVLLTVAALLSGGFAGIPADLLRLEAGYTFLSSIAIGAIVGGLMGKLVEPEFEQRHGEPAALFHP